MKVVGIIPARYESARLPGKALIDICGKPMIEWVYERSCRAKLLFAVYIATDSELIASIARNFTDRVLMTSSNCATGTDRIAEAAKMIDCDYVINIQGDEPLIEPDVIDSVIYPLINDGEYFTTAATLITGSSGLENKNFCKVVVDKKGYGIYFSRALIPFFVSEKSVRYLKHIGIYGYSKEFLLKFTSMPWGELEIVEHLEMLRAIENGYRIKVVITDYRSIGVDTEYELELVKKIINRSEK
jgi:3-deoxy-manno-octulosonate cytidylyltransferase (CMP-KDO synthetase)